MNKKSGVQHTAAKTRKMEKKPVLGCKQIETLTVHSKCNQQDKCFSTTG